MVEKYKRQFHKLSQHRKMVRILAITFIFLFVWADISRFIIAAEFDIDLEATPTTVDVGENVLFNWTMTGEFEDCWINFGDGNLTIITTANSSVYHKYAVQGQYNVTIFAKQGQTEVTDCEFINVKNNAPQFNISLLAQANEDQNVTVSVIDLVESDHDKIEGILTYIYDFADGEQITGNQSSCSHQWTNRGNYSVRVTVIDDQGALDQKTKNILINNQGPNASFYFDTELPPEQLRYSYYGTHDFRTDVVGSEPKDWTVHDQDDLGGINTALLRPNGDIIANWDDGAEAPHSSAINESTPDGTRIAEWGTLSGIIDKFTYSTATIGNAFVTTLTLNVYGRYEVGSTVSCYARFYTDNYQSSAQVIEFDRTASFVWKSVSWNGVKLNQTQLDSLEVELKAKNLDGPYREIGNVFVDTAYVEVNYEDPVVITVEDVGLDFKEVVKFFDDTADEQVWIETSFDAQVYGTVEFYIKSSDASQKAWALELWDSTSVAISITMSNDKWQYSTGGAFSDISGCGTPADDTWYHVRLDFCVSGSYQGLSAHQFKVYVNDSGSSTYSYSGGVADIRKVRFISGVSDKGTAWIDAIGFTWDLLYDINDNSYCVVSYPEKTGIKFIANCTDTASDLPSLRYYWNFGDSTFGWGKYITKTYLLSGRYVVNLTCKDDNGETSSFAHLVLVHNAIPGMENLSSSNRTIYINEGDTITFMGEPTDDALDIAQLSYWWDFDDISFNPYNVSALQEGGWANSHLYEDDFNGNAYVVTKDPEGAFSYNHFEVQVLNVDPLLSIWDASVVANISFEVYRNSITKNANFTFNLKANNETFIQSALNFTGSSAYSVYSATSPISMTLSKIWEVIINSSDVLPANSWFRCYIKLQFLSGAELVISTAKLYGGAYGEAEVVLNPYFFDNGDYTFMYPLTLNAHVWDPSLDDLSFNVNYTATTLLAINCSDSLPIEKTFSIEYPEGKASYVVNIYEEDNLIFANITVSQHVFIALSQSNSFPINWVLNFTIYPLIDLYDILEDRLNLTALEVIYCIDALNFIEGTVVDDDGGEGTLTISFTTENGIEFENLSPNIDILIPEQVLEGINVTFYIQTSDFDQIARQEEIETSNFKSEYVPISTDFSVSSGSIGVGGDLRYSNGDSITISPTSSKINVTTTFSLPNVENEEVIKYLRLIYTYKVNTSLVVNVSLYNFHNESWVLFDSTLVNTSYYTNAFSILSNEFINETYFVLVKIECGNAKLILDQFKVEYYSVIISDSDLMEHVDIPSSPVDFIFLTGSTQWGGDLQEQDNDYVTFTSFTDEDQIGHYPGSYSFENEEDNTQGTNIDFIDVCSYNSKFKIIGSHEGHSKVLKAQSYAYYARHNFESGITEGTIEYWWMNSAPNKKVLQYVRSDDGWIIQFRSENGYFQYYDGTWQNIKAMSANTWYHIRMDLDLATDTYNLSIDGTQEVTNADFVNNGDTLSYFYIEPDEWTGGTYYNYFDAFGFSWDETYEVGDNLEPYSGGLNLVSQFDLEAVRPEDLLRSVELQYSFKTNVSQEIETDLYNFDTHQWTTINSSSATSFTNFSYDLAGTNCISPYKQILVKFKGTNSSKFEFYLDSLKVLYKWEKVKLEYHSSVPDQYFDVVMLNGTLESFGDISLPDGNYSSFYPYGYGLYPATYSFTEEDIGTEGSDIDFVDIDNSVPSCGPEVEGLKGDHYKILKIKDSSATGAFDIENLFEASQSYGSIEFYVRITDKNKRFCFIPKDTSGNFLLRYRIDNGYHQRYTSSWGNVVAASNNEWYHIRIDFETTTGSYSGLSQNKWKLFVDGAEYGPYDLETNNVSPDRLRILSSTSDTSYTCYLDGMGYSWDSNYTVGDNVNVPDSLELTAKIQMESLIPSDEVGVITLKYSYKTENPQVINVSLYNFTAADWILVNSSSHISFFNGTYSITVSRMVNSSPIHDFYNSEFELFVKFEGANSTSDFDFLLDQLKIEYNFTETSFKGANEAEIDAVEGDYISFDSYRNYPYTYIATYSFEDDQSGGEPDGWDCSGTVSVENSLGDHNKVSKLDDQSASTASSLANSFADQTSGTIEFWVRMWSYFSTSRTAFIYIYDESTGNSIYFYFYVNGKIYYNDGSGHYIMDYSLDTWYHFKISFDCGENGDGTNDWHLWVDGVERSPTEGYNFKGTPSGMDKIKFSTSTSESLYALYVDAVAYSWDTGYDIGANYDPRYFVDATFDLTLAKMNADRLKLFESCQVSYSLSTNTSEQISVHLYNITSSRWVKYDTLSTNPLNYSSGSFTFTGLGFISSAYKVKLQFVRNGRITPFQLNVYAVEVKYKWASVLADFGINMLKHELLLDEDMSSPYLSIFEGVYLFDSEGQYLITMVVDDGNYITKCSKIITVKDEGFSSLIGNFPDQTMEDKVVFFPSDIDSPDDNASEFRFFWSFGDNQYNTDEEPSHAYSHAGQYNITLTTVDKFGNRFKDTRNIIVIENPPDVRGPYTFNGVEGQAILLDVDIFDSFSDEQNLDYEWYDSSELIASCRNPSIILQNGSFTYVLNVTDNSRSSSSVNISITVEDSPPIIIIPNYMYSGGSIVGSEGFFSGTVDDPGELELRAYGYDVNEDNNNLNYKWIISNGETDYFFNDLNSGLESIAKFRVKETAIYRGQVHLESTGVASVANFIITSIIDSNGNGIDNDFETRLLQTNESITSYSDYDKDGLSDLYEIGISNTSYLHRDTDSDGLYDGINNETRIGEATLGTDPLVWDCDNDELSDGMEVLGWVITSELYGERMVTSDPWSNNSDSDTWSDYEEYMAGTDPRDSDTDMDGVIDSVDPDPLKWDQDGDGISDGLELKIGTNPNNTDTDSDGLSDGDEVLGWSFKSDPLSKDGDHDFVADTAEMQTFKSSIDERYNLDDPISLEFGINCERSSSAQIAFMLTFGETKNEPSENKTYGIQNVPDLNVSIFKVDDGLLLYNSTTNKTRYFSQVVDIKDTIENLNLDYRGEYMIKINDTDAGCVLEQFEINVVGLLNPNDADFDKDGIMDGVEVGLLVEGDNRIDFKDSYIHDNLTVDMVNVTYDEFQIEIPDIGKVYDADLSLKIESDGTPYGTGNISILLIKNEINCSIDDAILIDSFEGFDNISSYTFQKTLDLSDYLNNNTITEFYGFYDLEVRISGSNSTENFTLTEYYIITDTYIEANSSQSQAWYTNPALKDSDLDGWDDYQEIFQKETNPLSPDTDADGIYDSFDRDPKKDVMIRVSPLVGSAFSQCTLQTATLITLGDTQETVSIFSTYQKADYYENPLWSAYFDGSHGSTTDLHYYLDVNDDLRSQPNNLEVTIELWEVDRYYGFIKKWDHKILTGDKIYNINSVGNSQTLIQKLLNGELEVEYELKIKLETIGIEKANTIAIYEKNGTVFNGHYQKQEKMNIIQLYVNDTPSANSPFEKGPNNIVIPTNLFTKTILNGYIQNERLNETFFYSSNEDLFKFISVDREGNTEQASSEIDFIMIRFDISSADAEKLLELIITCVVNETLDENNNTIAINSTLYGHYSTKLKGTSAVLMNLPETILSFIPWFCNFTESKQGSAPKDLADWFWSPLKAVGGFLGGLMITIVMLPAIIIALVIVFVVRVILLFVLPILAFILLLIIKVLLLVIAFILLAIHILTQVIMYLTMGLMMLAITAFTGGYTKFSWDFVEFQVENRVIRLQSEIVWVYWDFFNMSFPWAQDKVRLNGTTYMTSKKAILTGNSDVLIANQEPINQTEAPPTLHCNYTLINGTTYDFSTIYDDSNGGSGAPDPYYGVKLHLIAPNGTALAPLNMSVHPDYLPDPDYNKPVKYNYTIDLETLYLDKGLWHYFFSGKDNSSEHNPTVNPEKGYYLGPDMSIGPQFIFASAVSSISDDPYFSSGFLNDTFVFRAWWGCNETPSNISLCLITANKSLGTGLSNTYGIKKILMSPSVQNPNYSLPVEYNCSINFQNSNYTNSEIGWFSHYFEVFFSDGNVSYYYDISGQITEDGEVDLDSEFINQDIRGPFVTLYGPQLLDYNFRISPSIVPQLLKHATSVESESKIELEVVLLDPSGFPNSLFPLLIFEDIYGDREITLEPSNFWHTPLSQKYGENAVSCVYSLYGYDLGPGLWSFRFEAEGTQENYTLYGNEKIWMTGSLISFWDSFLLTISSGGYIPLGLFTMAIPTMKSAPYVTVALSCVAVLSGLIFSCVLQQQYCKNGDIGGLLGQSVALLLISFTTACSLAHTKSGSKLQLHKIFDIWYKYLAYISIIRIFLGAFPLDLGGFDLMLLQDILYLPLEVISMFFLGNIAKLLFSSIDLGMNDVGSVALQACSLIYTLGTMLLSMVGFIMFFIKTQGFAIYNLPLLET